ncbi:MAG: TonB-dependent receptor [Gammaproteobacteria bacterium]|nr:TonB-dependent receptor [Gammaproteobacteria bacterium]
MTRTLALSTLAAGLAVADGNTDQAPHLEEVTIVGTREQAAGTAGAAHILNTRMLARFAYTDVQRIARQVPGVSIQVEDGFGLRPNLSIRGVATERSGRITLLEDGVLIAPAPYSAPSAYYFPTAGRMAAFEVLKGPAAISQGPYTIGGAFNMISTPIPVESGGSVFAETGQHGTNRLHGTYGAAGEHGFGYLLETHQWFSDGYQSIDRSDNDTGLDVRDYTVKLAFAPAQSAHRVELKVQLAGQTSNQSYLGLTDVDFRNDPQRRYGVSALDRIRTDHEQVIVRHEYTPDDAWRLTTTVYDNRHARNWFKTEGIDFDGSANAEALSRTSWSSVVSAVNRRTPLGGLSAAQLAAILHGRADTAPGSIQLRANDRQYVSRGIQLGVSWSGLVGDVVHALRIGVRYHEDEEDRLQRNSSYRQENGMLRLDDLGRLGNAGNRIQEAEAVAVFAQDRIDIGDWTLTPGLRYEAIDQRRTRYEIRTGRTETPASRAAGNLRSTRANRTRIVLPGIGVLYRLNDRATLLAGVHKGFTAPSNAPDVRPEEAENYELGVRFRAPHARFEAVAFLSDYDNLLGECTSSSGVDCEAGDAFNGDAVTVRGLELSTAMDLAPTAGFGVPFEIVYTYIDGRFDTDIADTDFFGDVGAGDPVPYIPTHQVYSTLGIHKEPFSGHLSISRVEGACVRASCGEFERTDDSFTVDLAASYRLTSSVGLFARVENVADADDIVGRHPYGARPNKGRTFSVGVDLAW